MKSENRRSVLLSQNFLKSPGLVSNLLDRSGIGGQDTVLEIGPGRGVITEQLAARCAHVLAVEKDSAMARRLREKFESVPNVRVYEADFLRFSLPRSEYKVFANVPFNITADVIRKLTSAPCPPTDMYLIVQKEAAEKFMGRPVETLAALLIEPWFDSEIVQRLKRTDFVPVPRVDVVLARFSKRQTPLIADSDAQRYRDFVVTVFTAWKPSIKDTLASVLGRGFASETMASLGVPESATPGQVSFEQWLELYGRFASRSARFPKYLRRVEGAEANLKGQQARLQKRHITPRFRR